MNADLNVFNTCFTSRESVELEQRMLSRPIPVNDSIHIRSVMIIEDPLIDQNGQLQNVLLTIH